MAQKAFDYTPVGFGCRKADWEGGSKALAQAAEAGMSFARVPVVERTALEAETDTLFVLDVAEAEADPAY